MVWRRPFPLCPRTNHQDVDAGLGFQAFQTHGELIAARVRALSGANEENGVLVPAAHVNPLAVQGLTIVGPRDLWLGLPLKDGLGVSTSTPLTPF